MARPGQENVPKDDVPWYLKYGARVLGIVGAFCEFSSCFQNIKEYRSFSRQVFCKNLIILAMVTRIEFDDTARENRCIFLHWKVGEDFFSKLRYLQDIQLGQFQELGYKRPWNERIPVWTCAKLFPYCFSVCVLFGLWNCVSIVFGGVGCLVSGVLQVCLGLLVLIVEAPCCCMFVDFVQKVADLADSKPYWYRAAIYCV